MRVFRDFPIHDIFKIDYPTFMRLPVSTVKLMIDVAKEKRDKDAKAAQQAAVALNNASQRVENSATAAIQRQSTRPKPTKPKKE